MNKGDYHERILVYLERRGFGLHKAGSVSHKLSHIERDKTIRYFEGYAAFEYEKLISTIIERFPDQRPAPLPEFEYEGKRMVLQRWDGENAWYVWEKLYQHDLYEYKTSDYREHIKQQISRH